MAQPLPETPLLQGPMAPWPMEGDIADAFVTQGEIPRDLNGALYRIGPNVKRRSARGTYGFHHGDGMVHALYLRDGKASYRNRWVRTPKLALEDKHDRALFEWEDDFPDWRSLGWAHVVRNALTDGVPAGVANTNVVPWARKMLALGEDAVAPIVMDPRTLETLGLVEFARRLGNGVTPKVNEDDGFLCAHPKVDPETQELVGWGFSTEEPYVTAHMISADGREVRSIPLDAPYPPFLHDAWVTKDYLVLPICPVTFRHERVAEGRCILGWEPELGVHVAVVPRRGGGKVRWFRTDACYVLHTQSAMQVGDTLVCDGPIFPHPPYPADGLMLDWTRVPAGRLCRWTLDLADGSFRSEILDERNIEFPRIDDRFVGRPYRYGFNAGSSFAAGEMYNGFNSILRYDMADGARAVMHTIPGNVLVSEPVFAPRRADAPEGDGYLLVPVIRLEENRSDFLILDAQNLDREPVATIALPHRIPPTPHGIWLS
jgi:carotenoid cleavage dioxygenase-like enzyme